MRTFIENSQVYILCLNGLGTKNIYLGTYNRNLLGIFVLCRQNRGNIKNKQEFISGRYCHLIII